MHSCIYEGKVWHSRTRPLSHQFQYRLAMAYLDLDELPGIVRNARLLGHSHLAPASFRREDHFGQKDQPLCETVPIVRRRKRYARASEKKRASGRTVRFAC